MSIKKRKAEHIEICLNEKVDSKHNYWDDVRLIHNALPEINKNEIDTKIDFLGKQLEYPIFIGAMSGGYEKGKILNDNCAKAASELKIGFCIGSQRAALENPELADSYSIVKQYDIPFVVANIGGVQLIQQNNKSSLTLDQIEKIINMIGADAVAIRLNLAHEIAQPEGDQNAKGILKAITQVAQRFPVIVKEVGSGISKEVALLLKDAGVKAIEASGVSGTSWIAVEYYRAKAQNNKDKERIGKLFWNWGIPSPISILESKQADLPVIGSGGIRNGLDVAKSIALGADSAALAKGLLVNALKGSEEVKQQIKEIGQELKIAMFLTGCKNIKELQKTKYILTRKLKSWS